MVSIYLNGIYIMVEPQAADIRRLADLGAKPHAAGPAAPRQPRRVDGVRSDQRQAQEVGRFGRHAVQVQQARAADRKRLIRQAGQAAPIGNLWA